MRVMCAIHTSLNSHTCSNHAFMLQLKKTSSEKYFTVWANPLIAALLVSFNHKGDLSVLFNQEVLVA